MVKKVLEVLEKFYGYKSFRKGQEEIINEISKKRDVLAIMPTGAGKSICYQIPALIFEGISIVISPLISLMKDQVDALHSVGIKAAYINSTLDKYELEEILHGIRNNEYKIIYIAPERLDSHEFVELIKGIDISQIAVDEAHCVSQWGHDFRSSYRKIPDFINALKVKPVITAFTATASAEVREDIVRLLKLNNPEIFVSGFDRENLEIIVIKEGNKDRYLKEYIRKNSNLSGIIYCATRKEVDSVYEALLRLGYSVAKYHAGLNDSERRESQEDFINDKVNIIVATNAFGMGIDKPNVRYVIHNNMPQNIESYYQEIGRAGRDGEKSECILLFTPGDIHLQKYLIDMGLQNEDRKNSAYKKLQDMVGLVYNSGCYRRFILRYFGEDGGDDCNNCSNCKSEGENIDRTIDTQKVLSCIYRMKRGFGTTVLVDVLRGSKNQKILALGFDKLSTYGIMKEYKKDDLVSFVNTLVSHGFIEQVEGTYPILKLNQRSFNVIKGEEKVILKEAKVRENKYVINDLFRILKDLRFAIAIEEKVPPYVIFGDSTLREMSNTYPITEEEILEITGVGEVKYEKYGKQFIQAIKDYIAENKIIKKSVKVETEIKPQDSVLYIDTDEELYLMLKEIRGEFAKKEGKYPYSIISQNTLKEISGRYPLTLEELKDISGLGPKKVEYYGKKIIQVVDEYVSNNNIQRNWIDKGRKKLVIDNEVRGNPEISINMLEEGYSILEISEKVEVSVSTILGYVTDYIKETGDISFSLNLKEFFKDEEEKLIVDACHRIGIDKVGELKKELPRDINYESIRAVILKNYYNIA
ncbi:DNA helicase RecQ [Clostridium paraputrificum]|uniref:DNA helicase RecQ n=1 Tax=Clostridium TaxID=1485 RepID=UPI003D3402D9